MKNISVIVLGVFNEELRISSLLDSMVWSDEVFLLDKQSTDSTLNIAKKYRNVKVMSSDNINNPIEFNSLLNSALNKARNEWVFLVTASTLIDIPLVKKALELVNSDNFDYDILSLPLKFYLYGISEEYSPWGGLIYRDSIYRKNTIEFQNRIHDEIVKKSNKRYIVKDEKIGYAYHLTHESIDMYLERHIRYARIEVDQVEKNELSLKKFRKDLLYSIYYIVFKKKSILHGWDGLGLGLSYVLYHILKYLFLWQAVKGKGSKVYKEIRKRNSIDWDSENQFLNK